MTRASQVRARGPLVPYVQGFHAELSAQGSDLSIKERALARTAPVPLSPHRYRPPDPLLAFLEAL